VVQEKRYPSGTLPIVDAVEIEIAPRGAATLTRVLVVTLPIDRAPAAKRAGDQGARAIGGAGMDVLVGRAKRVWQIASDVGVEGNELAPLALAGVLASLLLAPIVPPGGGDDLRCERGARAAQRCGVEELNQAGSRVLTRGTSSGNRSLQVGPRPIAPRPTSATVARQAALS
jgi:hypothetical protein